MWTKIFFCFAVFCAIEARRCRGPKFGRIASVSDELLEFECIEGFSRIGEQSGVCNKTTGKHDANVACIPMAGEDGELLCGDKCPRDFNYLMNFELETSSEEELENAVSFEDILAAEKIDGRAHGQDICTRLCRFSLETCMRSKKRKMRKRCFNCLKTNKCRTNGNTFWGRK